MKKLLIYGDSILRGVTYDAERGAHLLCRGYKFESVGALGYEVKNRSRMGATISRGLQTFDETAKDADRDATILFEYGGNDCDFEWGAISDDPKGEFLPHTPEDRFTALYGEAIEKARATGANVVLSSLPPIDAERYMKTISRGRSYENILSWLGDTSMLYRWQEHYNRIVENLAEKYHCALLDLRGAFLLSHRYKDLISADGIHPTDEGHDLLEGTIRNYLSAEG